MMNKDVKTLLSEIEKVRKDLDAIKTSQASMSEQLAAIAEHTTPPDNIEY